MVINRIKANLLFTLSYLKCNLASALEYKASFITQVLGMAINNAIWVIFWWLYFTKFPILNSWQIGDVILLWAVITFSYGIAVGLFRNCFNLPIMVVEGQLDYYLTLPKPILLHVLVSRLGVFSLGDLFFGPVLLFCFLDLTAIQVFLYLLTGCMSAIIILSFFVLVGSLVFFVGHVQTLANQLRQILMHFSTYPAVIFDGFVKVILFTIIPAGFISTVPVELIRSFNWAGLGQLLIATVIFLGLAIMTFYLGLKRYESGNLLKMQS